MRKLAMLTAFLAGYCINDIVGEFAPLANAEVAGMDYSDLRSDSDFKKAVRRVLESNCSVDGGYVDGDYLYGMEISC